MTRWIDLTCQAPGCDEPLVHVRAGARFCSAACRTRAWKDRKGYRDGRRVRKTSRNGQRARRRTPDLRISYRKAVDAMRHYPGAEEKLRALLTDRQRKALDA